MEKCKLYRSKGREQKKKNDAICKNLWRTKLKKNLMKYEQYKVNERYRKLQNKENKAVEVEEVYQCLKVQTAHSAINKRFIAAYSVLNISYRKVYTKNQKSSKN